MSAGNGGCIVYNDGVLWAGKTDIFISSDTGATWHSRSLPMTSSIQLYDLQPYDKNTCLASAWDGKKSLIYLTTNGGLQWKLLKELPLCYCVTFWGSPTTLILLNAFPGKLLVSQDGGNSWGETVFGNWTQRFVPLSSKKAIILSEGKLFTTIDKGISWQSSSMQTEHDCWSVCLDSCHSERLYICNEGLYANGVDADKNSDIIMTEDLGNSYHSLYTKKTPDLTGCMAATRSALFCQTINDGVIRSTDYGSTWKPIGGPSAVCDSRMFCAINNNLLFAIDGIGRLWRSDNSGGDEINSSASFAAAFSSTKIINDTIFAIIPLPIYLKDYGTAMADLQLKVQYSTTHLQALSATSKTGRDIYVPARSIPGNISLHLNASDLQSSPSDSVIGYVIFKWNPLEADCEDIVFDSVLLTPQASSCIESVPTSFPEFHGMIGLYSWCVESSVPMVHHDEPVLTIYPNPARQTCTIDISGSAISSVLIFDSKGAACIHYNSESGGSRAIIDISSLSAGAYMVVAFGDHTVGTAILYKTQ